MCAHRKTLSAANGFSVTYEDEDMEVSGGGGSTHMGTRSRVRLSDNKTGQMAETEFVL